MPIVTSNTYMLYLVTRSVTFTLKLWRRCRSDMPRWAVSSSVFHRHRALVTAVVLGLVGGLRPCANLKPLL